MNKREYLLTCFKEEANEVAQAVSKCIRFTENHEHQGSSNLDRLRIEITDFMTLMHMVEAELGVVFDKEPSAGKAARTLMYMEHSKRLGALDESN